MSAWEQGPDTGILRVDALLTTAAIRERCRNIAAAVTAGHSRHFRIDPRVCLPRPCAWPR